jgi:hypothetical protein
MKKIILTIAAVALGLQAWAQAPTYDPQNLVINGVVNALVYSNVNAVIDCRKQASVGVMISYTQMGTTNTATNSFAFIRGLDGIATNYETATNLTVITDVARNGTGYFFTNIPTWGCGYLKLTNIYDGNPTTSMTNINIWYGSKISSP